MERKTLVNELKKYFSIKELVCPHVFNKYREDQMWSFFSMQALEILLVLRRDILKVPLIINSWKDNYTQRGLRCNLCAIPKEKTRLEKVYMSAHCTGEAFDITVKGMTAEQARRKIDDMQDFLPYPVRMESGVTWLHIDTYDEGNGKKVNYFSA